MSSASGRISVNFRHLLRGKGCRRPPVRGRCVAEGDYTGAQAGLLGSSVCHWGLLEASVCYCSEKKRAAVLPAGECGGYALVPSNKSPACGVFLRGYAGIAAGLRGLVGGNSEVLVISRSAALPMCGLGVV